VYSTLADCFPITRLESLISLATRLNNAVALLVTSIVTSLSRSAVSALHGVDFTSLRSRRDVNIAVILQCLRARRSQRVRLMKSSLVITFWLLNRLQAAAQELEHYTLDYGG